MKLIIATIITLALLMTSCAESSNGIGNVVQINAKVATLGVQSCLNGAPFTKILANYTNDLIMFVWPDAVNYNFIAFDASSPNSPFKIPFPGNQASFKTVNELIDYLKSYGWKFIDSSEVPRKIVDIIRLRISAYAMTGVLQTVDSLTLFVIPSSLFRDCKLCPKRWVQ